MICLCDQAVRLPSLPNLAEEVGRIRALIWQEFPNPPNLPNLFFRARAHACTRYQKNVGKVGKVGKSQAGEGLTAPNLKTEAGKVGSGIGRQLEVLK